MREEALISRREVAGKSGKARDAQNGLGVSICSKFSRVWGLGGVSGPSDRDPTVPERRATRRGVGGCEERPWAEKIEEKGSPAVVSEIETSDD